MTEPKRHEAAECSDCDWADQARGARGRGAIHHRNTGHHVLTTLETTWPRSIRPPGQEAFPELEPDPA